MSYLCYKDEMISIKCTTHRNKALQKEDNVSRVKVVKCVRKGLREYDTEDSLHQIINNTIVISMC